MRIKLVHVNGIDDDLVFSNKPMDVPIEEFESPGDEVSDSLPDAKTNNSSSIVLRQPTFVFPSASTNIVNNGGTPGFVPTLNASNNSRNLPFVFSGAVNSGTSGNGRITASNLLNNPFRSRIIPRDTSTKTVRITPHQLSTPSVPPVSSGCVNNSFAAQGVVVPERQARNPGSSTTPAIVKTFNVIQPVLETSRNNLDGQNISNSVHTTQTINILTTETIQTTNYVRHQSGVENGKVQKTVKHKKSPHLLNGKTKAQRKKILELLDDIPMKAIRYRCSKLNISDILLKD